MGDWVNAAMTAGINGQSALKQIQNLRGPVDAAAWLKNLQKTGKLASEQLTFLSEKVNDFSYVVNSVSGNGQNVIERELTVRRLSLPLAMLAAGLSLYRIPRRRLRSEILNTVCVLLMQWIFPKIAY